MSIGRSAFEPSDQTCLERLAPSLVEHAGGESRPLERVG